MVLANLIVVIAKLDMVLPDLVLVVGKLGLRVWNNNLLSANATYHLQHATLLDLATTQLVNGCNLIKRNNLLQLVFKLQP
jgi:hypothetical protein